MCKDPTRAYISIGAADTLWPSTISCRKDSWAVASKKDGAVNFALQTAAAAAAWSDQRSYRLTIGHNGQLVHVFSIMATHRTEQKLHTLQLWLRFPTEVFALVGQKL